MRDKFTNHPLYLFLQKHTADLYRMVYNLALNEAHESEHAFNFERGHTTQKFIGCGNWDNFHEGLLPVSACNSNSRTLRKPTWTTTATNMS